VPAFEKPEAAAGPVPDAAPVILAALSLCENIRFFRSNNLFIELSGTRLVHRAPAPVSSCSCPAVAAR